MKNIENWELSSWFLSVSFYHYLCFQGIVTVEQKNQSVEGACVAFVNFKREPMYGINNLKEKYV